MDIVFNTRTDLKIGSARVNIYNKYVEFSNFDDVNAEFNDFDNYKNYDFAILHGGDDEIFEAKAQNEDIVVGLAKLDASTKEHVDKLRKADFLIADSHSQRDYYLKYNDNIVTIPLIEEMPDVYKRHTQQEQIVLSYHGNKEHLKSFDPILKNALERIDDVYDIKLLAIYDIESLGMWSEGAPDIDIEHVQHSKSKNWNRIHRRLVEADIGLVPAGGSLSYDARDELLHQTIDFFTPWTRNDYIQRFKSNSNAGRAFVFMQLGIPVVATPISELRFVIDEGKTGFTALTEEAWIDSITRLHQSVQLREDISQNAYEVMNGQYSPTSAAKKLNQYITDFDEANIHRSRVLSSRRREPYQKLPSETDPEIIKQKLFDSLQQDGIARTVKKLAKQLR